jgi:hypothetical protein
LLSPGIFFQCGHTAAGEKTAFIREKFAVISFPAAGPLKTDGWEERIYNKPVSYRVSEQNGETVLCAKSDGAASMLYKEISYNPATYPLISWSWNVTKLPRKGTANDRANNDYAARLYIIFPGWTFLTSHLLEYVWDNDTPVETVKPSLSSRRCAYIVVTSGTRQLGTWVELKRNVVEDYKKVFGKGPGRDIGAICLMTDSDNTRSSAEACYGPITIGK